MFHISVKGVVRGPVGTFLVIWASLPDSVVMDCGDWSFIPSSNTQFTVYERQTGQGEEVNFEYRGYRAKQCLGPNTFFGDDSFTLFTTIADQYGNPQFMLWDPEGKFTRNVYCGL